MDEADFITHLKSNIKTHGKASWQTIRAYLRAKKEFEDFLHSRKPTPNLVKEYVAYITDTYKINGQQPKLGGLRHYLRFLKWDDAQVKELVPIPRAIETKTSQHILSIEDIQALFNATKDDILTNTMLKALYYSALRRQELLDLDIDDVRMETGVVIVRNGKGKNGQPEEITPKQEFFDAVDRYLKVRPTPTVGHERALFIQPKNKTWMTHDSIRRFILQAQATSGIRPDIIITPHIFRASVITHMNNAGASTTNIMGLSRHKSFDAMKRYVRPSREEKRATVDRFVPTITESTIEAPKLKQDAVKLVEPIPQPQQQPTLKQQYYQLLKQGLITPQEFQDLLSNSTNHMYG